MFPLRDNNPSPRFPFVTLLLMAANVAVFWLEITQKGLAADVFVERYAMIPARDFFVPGGAYLKWLQPYLTSMFLHGGFMHILANMWSFWIFGDNVEGRMGPLRFILFYLLTGLAAAFTHAWLNPASTLPVVGASGAISGVMGAYMFLFPRARLHMFTLLVFWPIFFEIPAFVFLIIWFLGQLLSGAQTAAAGAADTGGIAFAAHIGGFVAGAVLLPFFLPRKRAIGRS